MGRIGTRYEGFIGQSFTVCGAIWRANSQKQELALNWLPLGIWVILIECLHFCSRRQKGWSINNTVIVVKLSSVRRETGDDYNDIILCVLKHDCMTALFCLTSLQ